MTDIGDLIARLKGDIFDAVPDDNDMQNVLTIAATALEDQQAENQRLRKEVEYLEAVRHV